MALTEPSHMMLDSDLSAYRQEVEGAMLGFAFRSAFRLGKDDDLTSEYMLVHPSIRGEGETLRRCLRDRCVAADGPQRRIVRPAKLTHLCRQRITFYASS